MNHNTTESPNFDNGNVASQEPTQELATELTSETMPHEARRALVNLMRLGVIISSQKPKLFEYICRYENAIRVHLSEIYLQLILDPRAGIAFISGIQETDDNTNIDDIPSLITKRPLSLYDTLILLCLREYYQERETHGEQKVVIDIERLESFLTPFIPIINNSKADRRSLKAVIERMISRKILSHLRGSEERYEITPVIRYVVNAEFLETMLQEYRNIAITNGAAFEDGFDDNSEIA